MQKIIKNIVYTFLGIFVATATLSLIGLAYLWFFPKENGQTSELPYLQYLLGSVIVEVIGVVIFMVKKGMRYLPDVHLNKKEEDTLEFMRIFISSGSTVAIVSNRVAWLQKSSALINEIKTKARNGTHIEVITPQEVSKEIKAPFMEVGVNFIVTNESVPPEARFTLINGNRSGAEKLAIARGVHPDHEITVFDNNSGPQIIAMAKDIIRKSKEKIDANKMV